MLAGICQILTVTTTCVAVELRLVLVVEAPDLILNAAAYTAVDKAERDEATARAINADAVDVMVEQMASTGGKVVHVSTDYVFDGTSPVAYRPEDARNPQSAYGRTKAEGEDRLRPEDLLVGTMIRLMTAPDELGVVADQAVRRLGRPALRRPCGVWSRTTPLTPSTIATTARSAGTTLRSQ